MTQYMLTYFMGEQPSDPEQAKALRGQWEDWVKGLAEAMINPGTPLGAPIRVTQDGILENNNTINACGFSIFEAASMDDALKIAQNCPHLHVGHVDIAEVKTMG